MEKASKKMSKNEKKLRSIVLLLIMLFTSLFGSLFMLFPYMPLVFFNRKLFHSLIDLSLNAWFGLAVYLLEKVGKIKIYLHKAKNDKDLEMKKSAIVMMNHRTRLDWLFYFCILYRLNALSNIKIILKKGLDKIPGAGWAMQTALFIFIQRKWEIDRNILSKAINYYNSIQKKVFVLIFPEGTNLTASTRAKSDKFASEHNLKPYTQVLHPRVTGLSHVFNEMKKINMIDSIHDVTIGYCGETIPETELQFLNGSLPDEIHFYIDKFDSNQVVNGSGDEAANKEMLEKWIADRWNVKETFLKSFYEDGIDSEKFQLLQEDYITERPNGTNMDNLFIYPTYWLISCSLVIYLIYSSLIGKMFFILSLSFFIVVQYFGNGIENFISNPKGVFKNQAAEKIE